MNKCKIYLDFVNSDSYDENDKEALNNILKHINNCSDCSNDKSLREKMLFNLSNLTEPDYPYNLHEVCLDKIYPNKNSDILEVLQPNKLLINLLKPLEISLSIACIIMIYFMFQLNSNNLEISNNESSYNNNLKKIKVAEASDNFNEEGIEKVTKEEVKEFLAQLEKFERTHNKNEIKSFRPQIKLVTDK